MVTKPSQVVITMRSFLLLSYATLGMRSNVSPSSKLKTLSLLPQWLWLPNLAKPLYTIKSHLQQCHKISSSLGLAGSCDKSNMWYLYYHKTCGHETWQVVSYYIGLPPIKSGNPLSSWSYEIMRQIKNILSLLTQSQSAFTWSKLTIETLEQVVKYVQS